jgi:hypothetical protein
MQTFKFLTLKRYILSCISFLLAIVLIIFMTEILIHSLGRTPSASMIATVMTFGLIGMIATFILLFLYSILLNCTFDNNKITFKNGLRTYTIDTSKGELLDIHIENADSSYRYYKNITEEYSFENKALLENRGLYAPNSWYVVFVSTGSLRHKNVSCINSANKNYIALEYRKELVPILEKLLPYCKNPKKKEML